MSDLPSNVYRLPQRAFDAIPGALWVYWLPDGLRRLHETLPRLGDVAATQAHLSVLETQGDDQVYHLHGISAEDCAAIEAELAGGTLVAEDDETEHAPRNTRQVEERAEEILGAPAAGRLWLESRCLYEDQTSQWMWSD